MSGISERNPYVGPRSIQQGEPLYGRSVEVDELYDRLQAWRIVVLHSPSGAGKSSLVQAGLIPRLKAGKFDLWKPIRVNLDPRDLKGVPEGANRYLLSAMLSLEEELPEGRRRGPAELGGMGFLDYLEGGRIATASEDNTARLWGVESEKQDVKLKGHTGWVVAVTFSPDGDRIVTASEDGTSRLLDDQDQGITAVAFSPDRKGKGVDPNTPVASTTSPTPRTTSATSSTGATSSTTIPVSG